MQAAYCQQSVSEQPLRKLLTKSPIKYLETYPAGGGSIGSTAEVGFFRLFGGTNEAQDCPAFSGAFNRRRAVERRAS
jgi:hypothetical protein